MAGRFTFANREEGFDNHIEKSIRGYNDLMDDVLKLSEYFVEDGTDVIDIGCSSGKFLNEMSLQNDAFANNVGYVGVEIEGSFKPQWSKNSNYNRLTFVQEDIRSFDWRGYNTSLITSIFSLQFMPLKDRRGVLKNVYESLVQGGGFIMAEKTYSTCSKIQDMISFIYYDHKKKSFSADDIMQKEVQLRHMMKPMESQQINQMIWDAGFHMIDKIWQNHNFTCWLAIKD